MRLFLAIRLPEEVLGAVCAVQDALRDRIERQGVRFTKPEKMHLTLAFLGNDLQSEEAQSIASAAAPNVGPLRLEIGTVGAFPGVFRPRTVWLRVEGQGLAELAGLLGTAFGLPAEPYVGHVTLARVSPASKAVGRALAEFLRQHQPVQVAWEAGEFELIASLPSGDYEVIQRYPLVGP